MHPVNHIRMRNTFKLKPGMISYQEIQAKIGFLSYLIYASVRRTLTYTFFIPTSTEAYFHCLENTLLIEGI